MSNKTVILQKPGWVLPNFEYDLDFDNDRFFGCSLSDFTFTRNDAGGTSAATDLVYTDPAGTSFNRYGLNQIRRKTLPNGKRPLLMEVGPVQNALVNSTAPVTQTTASLATGTYTYWQNGGNTAQLSVPTANILNITLVSGTPSVGSGGGFTNFASSTQGSPVIFTIATAASTVQVSVSGINQFQLENNPFPTSFIATNAAVRTRSPELLVANSDLATKLFTPVNVSKTATVRAEGTSYIPDSLSTPVCVMLHLDDTTASNRLGLFQRLAGTSLPRQARGVNSFHGGASSGDMGSDTWVMGQRVAICMASAQGLQAEAANGGTVTTGSDSFPDTMSRWAVGIGVSISAWYGLIHRISVSTTTRSSTQVQSLSNLTG